MAEEQLKHDALEYHEFPTAGKISIAPTNTLRTSATCRSRTSPAVLVGVTQEEPVGLDGGRERDGRGGGRGRAADSFDRRINPLEPSGSLI